MISSAVLVYFNEQKLVPIKASDVFWFGSILWVLIIIFRSTHLGYVLLDVLPKESQSI
jgi:hypothetical protein